MLKSLPKFLTIAFLSIFIFQLFCLAVLLTLPIAVQAADGRARIVGDLKFVPQVGIPGSEFAPGTTYTFSDGTIKPIALYIQAIYRYAIGIIGILAAIVMMVGGVLWIIAGGNATQVGEAKAWIGAAITGLILALTSYLILTTVNPALVNLKTPGVTGVEQFTTGSCQLLERTADGKLCIENSTLEDCDKLYGSYLKGRKCPVFCCSGTKIFGFAHSYCYTGEPGINTEGACNTNQSNAGFGEIKYFADGKCQDNICVPY